MSTLPSTAYACVYRHPLLQGGNLRLTLRAAATDALVKRYLDRYQRAGSVIDLGDDPSFFCAEQYGLPPSWGVCRADVRATVKQGDFIVFICARTDDGSRWDYHLTGVDTVADTVARDDRCTSAAFAPYAKFLNILGRREVHGWVQQEVICNHDDWAERMAAPYVIFDPDPALTKFDIEAPLHLATYQKSKDVLERWDDHTIAQQVQGLLGLPTDRRGLRTTNPYIAHAKLRLDSRRLADIRHAMIAIVESVGQVHRSSGSSLV